MILSDQSLPALDGIADPWRAQAKLPSQRSEREAQLPHGPEAQQAPGGHLPALAPCGHHLPRVCVSPLRL